MKEKSKMRAKTTKTTILNTINSIKAIIHNQTMFQKISRQNMIENFQMKLKINTKLKKLLAAIIRIIKKAI